MVSGVSWIVIRKAKQQLGLLLLKIKQPHGSIVARRDQLRRVEVVVGQTIYRASVITEQMHSVAFLVVGVVHIPKSNRTPLAAGSNQNFALRWVDGQRKDSGGHHLCHSLGLKKPKKSA